MVATSVFNAIPGTAKELCDFKDFHYDREAKIYFVGFWTNRGSCDISVLNLLSSLHGKKVALFGTCGMGNSPAYYSSIEHSVSVWIESDNEYLGAFICQGKMPQKVRQKYESIRTARNALQISLCLRNFDEALTHPDSLDLEHSKVFTEKTLKKIQAED